MTVEILQGDCLAILSTLPDRSVHCVITSPPYWGLRSYGIGTENGELGREAMLEEYMANLAAVFREVRRVLRDDGTLWLNLGNSYCASPKGNLNGQDKSTLTSTKTQENAPSGINKVVPGLKPKDLVGIPWRVAFELQADGWWLRSDIIWSKPNPMPESVTDRPTKAHEYVFLLSKSARYFYDAAAIREPLTSGPSDIKKMVESKERFGGKNKDADDPLLAASGKTNVGRKRAVGGTYKMPSNWAPSESYADQDPRYRKRSGNKQRKLGDPETNSRVNTHMGNGVPWEDSGLGRNKRSVWEIATQPFPGAHFATFPEALVKPCIQAGTSERGCCAECGAPFARQVERSTEPHPNRYSKTNDAKQFDAEGNAYDEGGNLGVAQISHTLGWHPTCEHKGEPVPCTVLDPFAGAGTVGVVAQKGGRHAILIELNLAYCDMMRERMAQGSLL